MKEGFEIGDVFYIPLLDEVIQCKVSVCEERSVNITAEAAFMIKYEQEIKNGRVFDIDELMPMLREFKISEGTLVYDGSSLEVSIPGEPITFIPVPLVSDNEKTAELMKEQLVAVIAASYCLSLN